MSTLHIQLLGGCHLYYEGRPLAGVDTARLQSVLGCLLIHARQPQSRHYLAALLWPDSTDSQSRTNLRKYIHQLRGKLPLAEQLLHVDTNSIGWRADAPAHVDVHAFEHHLSVAQHQPDAITALEQAIALYRGTLLPGCYDEWIAPYRERFASRYLHALDQLAQLLEQAGDYLRAIEYVQQLLEQDTLRESAYRRLIRLYALAGNRAKAIAAYQQCVVTLRQTMDIEPGAATQQLFERVKSSAQAPTMLDSANVRTGSEQMTVLWADIAGFGELSTQYDSQILFADLATYMNMLSQLIQTGGGQVVKRMGDALLTIFTGATDALKTAYIIQNELQAFNRQQRRDGHPPLPTRIGLATGEVLIAHLDVDGGREVEIIGQCVNVAMRLQRMTPINGITLDQMTYSLCKSGLTNTPTSVTLTTQNHDLLVYILNSVDESH